jgi:hypothetical protein
MGRALPKKHARERRDRLFVGRPAAGRYCRGGYAEFCGGELRDRGHTGLRKPIIDSQLTAERKRSRIDRAESGQPHAIAISKRDQRHQSEVDQGLYL